MTTAIPELGDGLFHFGVRKGEEVLPRAIDVITLKLACEEAEAMHRLEKDAEGLLKPTAAFLDTLAGKLKGCIEDCTPSLAYQLWSIGPGLVDDLKKNMSEPPNSPTGTDLTPADSAGENGPGSTSTSTE